MKIINKKKDGKKRHLLKDIVVGEVSSCGRGANQGAAVTLLKAADGITKSSFNDVLRSMGLSEKLRELLSDMFKMNGAMRDSLHSIMNDPEIKDKKAAIRESVTQFAQAMESVISDTDIIKEIAKAFKTESGKSFPAGDYAYVPKPDKPSTWKLRLTSEPGGEPDPRIVGMAVAALGEGFRGNRVQIPQADKAKVVARVRAAWLKANKNKGEKDLPAIIKKSKEEESNMDKEAMVKLQKSNDELQEKLAKSEFLASLTDVEKAHYNGLDKDGKSAFEKMDADARKTTVDEAIAKKAASDETIDVEGTTVRKSEVGPGVFAFMKAQQAKMDAAVAKADRLEAESVQKGLEAEAEKLWPNTAGTAADKAQMLKSIRSMPEAQQEAQMKMLKAADEAMAKSFKEEGQAGSAEAGSASEKLNKKAEELAAKDGITFEKAYSKVLETAEGSRLYSETLAR